MHRDGLEQAGEPSAHSTGKWQSTGTWTGECAEHVWECGAYRERRRVRRCEGYWKATGNCKNCLFRAQGESRRISGSSISANPVNPRCAFSFSLNPSPMLLLPVLMGVTLVDGVWDSREEFCVNVDGSMLP